MDQRYRKEHFHEQVRVRHGKVATLDMGTKGPSGSTSDVESPNEEVRWSTTRLGL